MVESRKFTRIREAVATGETCVRESTYICMYIILACITTGSRVVEAQRSDSNRITRGALPDRSCANFSVHDVDNQTA